MKGMERADSDLDGMAVVEIPELVMNIGAFQEVERSDKMLLFYNAFMLNYGYFRKACKADGYMKIRVAGGIIYCIYWLILKENKILFPCNRRLEQYVGQCENKPEKIVEKCRTFYESMHNGLLEDIINSYHAWTKWKHNSEIRWSAGAVNWILKNGGNVVCSSFRGK